MRPYNSQPENTKAWKNKNCKIRFRWFGSTHANATKKRIVRWGKRVARRQAKEVMKEELGWGCSSTGEQELCKLKVAGSTPVISTKTL